MTDVVVVAAALVGALLLGLGARSVATSSGPRVDVSGLAQGPAAVVFTQDDCTTCEAAMERIGAFGVAIRQVRAEDEPDELASRGVEGVPTTVIIDAAGRVRGQFGGVPRRRPLRRAVRRAREIPGGSAREL